MLTSQVHCSYSLLEQEKLAIMKKLQLSSTGILRFKATRRAIQL
jgi:hypothetical protein